MTKTKSLKATVALLWMLLVAALAVPVGATAQTVSFRDDFDYDLGYLYGQGNWCRYGTNTEDPVQVITKSLTFEGYTDATNPPTKCVKLGSTKSGQDLVKRFTDEEDGITSGTVYYSALINVEKAPTGNVYVMTFIPKKKGTNVQDGIGTTELGRLFIGKSDNDNEVKVGISRGSTTAEFATQTLEIGRTYLVVVKYVIKALGLQGEQDVYLYVNPTPGFYEPTFVDAYFPSSTNGSNTSGSRASYGLQGIELRQGTNASTSAPEMYVGSLRVSDTFGGLFGIYTDTTPKIKVPSTLRFESNFVGDEDADTIHVKGANLTKDVTVSVDNDAVTLSKTTLSAADVMSENGAELIVKLKFTEGQNTATVKFTSEGAEEEEMSVEWEGVPYTALNNLKEVYSQKIDESNPTLYRYTGEGVITYIDNGQTTPFYYVQDNTGAIVVNDRYKMLSKEYSIGDKVTTVMFTLYTMNGTVMAMPVSMTLGNTVSTGNTVEPVAATLAELKATPGDYMQRLVKVSGLKFKDVAENATFAEGMEQPVVTDGENEANVRIFKGTSLIGTEIPTDDITLVGLFTSSSMVIGPRGTEDIIKTPSITVTPDAFEQKAGVKGKSVEVGTIHISAKNMTEKTTLYITGTAADQFSLSQTEIAAGNTETDITVTYNPDEVAVHRAYVNVECPSIENYSKLVALSAYAIDENNKPTVTVTPSTVPAFEIKAGETQEQTLEVSSANLPDYLYAKLKYTGEEANGFVLNSSMFMRNYKQNLKVTFSNKEKGTYTNAIIFYTLGMEEVEMPLEGVVKDSKSEEEKEGQEYVLSTENPLKQLNETFDNVEKNKPLAIDRWTNSALEGTRAWWGYTLPDNDSETPNENVAKVTPYDSSIESGKGTDTQMILVTPPLDFLNAETKVFTFKVRGDYLQDNQVDKLELCYITKEGSKVYTEVIEDCVMPSTKDESGKWYPYTVDLTGLNVEDVFFMGFRFMSVRGVDCTATYYVDDVTWGIATSGITNAGSSNAADNVTVYDISGNAVANSTKALAPGMYIVKSVAGGKVTTKKVMVK